MATTGHKGSWGLPDLGITEWLQKITTPGKAYASSGGSDLIGKAPMPDTSYIQLNKPLGQSNQQYTNPIGPQLPPGGLPQQTNVIGNGSQGTGGQVSSGQDGGNQGAPMENAPGEPQIDFNAIFAPAFEALSQQEGATRGAYDVMGREVEQGTQQRIEGLQGEQASRLQNFGEQRSESTAQTEGVIDQARRQAAELLQGIQSRYGGTTGTGRFSSEILGSQATQNIAQNQAALQNTLGKISQAENNLKTEVLRLVNQEQQNLETNKLKIRANLDQALADISKERGRLEGEKAQMRIDTLMQYQNVLSGVEQRNTQFKQQLYLQAQEAQQQIAQLKAKAQANYQKELQLTAPQLASWVEAGIITPEEARSQSGIKGLTTDEDQLQLTGKTTDQTLENALNIAM